MLKGYDTSSVLSIIAEKEPGLGAAGVAPVSDSQEVEFLALMGSLPLFEVSDDPYNLMHETYWSIFFQGWRNDL